MIKTRLITVLLSLTFKEKITLVYGLLLDWLFNRVPKHLFVLKNITYKVLDKGYRIEKYESCILVSAGTHKFLLRKHGSDFRVFDQIIVGEELKMLVKKMHEKCDFKPRILDCGANIGMSAIYMKMNFPDCSVIAIEPNENNYVQLCKNVRINELRDVITLNKGVWYKPTTLMADYTFRDGGDWSFALQESTGDRVSEIFHVDSIPNIMLSNGWDGVDVIKMDIEGAEFALFEHFDEWSKVVRETKIISIEIHEERGDRMMIERKLMECNFRIEHSGELTIGVRI